MNRTSDVAKCALFAASLHDDLAPLLAADYPILPLFTNIADASTKLQELKERPRMNGRQNLINSNVEFQIHPGSTLSADDKEFSRIVKDLAAFVQTSLK